MTSLKVKIENAQKNLKLARLDFAEFKDDIAKLALHAAERRLERLYSERQALEGLGLYREIPGLKNFLGE